MIWSVFPRVSVTKTGLPSLCKVGAENVPARTPTGEIQGNESFILHKSGVCSRFLVSLAFGEEQQRELADDLGVVEELKGELK